MERLKSFFRELPYPVRWWSYTIMAALIYIVVRYGQTGTQEAFGWLDRIIALYGAISLLIFLGFFMTKDPE
jgi:hypothetical protein